MDTAADTQRQPTKSGWIADDISFGARLVLIRQRMGWGNITEAARQCGLHAESWRLWEQGREPHRLTTIAMTIATRTGCDYLWLVHGPDRGAALPRRHYVDARVVARVGHPPGTPPPTGQDTPGIRAYDARRPVQQNRPVGGGSLHPPTPVAR